MAGTSIVLLRPRLPAPPHVTEQVDQVLHADHAQSTVNIMEYKMVLQFAKQNHLTVRKILILMESFRPIDHDS